MLILSGPHLVVAVHGQGDLGMVIRTISWRIIPHHLRTKQVWGNLQSGDKADTGAKRSQCIQKRPAYAGRLYEP